MSAQHPNIFERLFGKHEPEPTPWQQFQEKQQTDAMRLVAFLRAPASEICARLGRPVPRQTGPMRQIPTRGDVQLTMLARPVVTVQPVPPPAPKPEPRRYSHEQLVEMIRTQPRSTADLPAHVLEEVQHQVAALHEGEDLVPQWRGENDAPWLNSERADLFADVRQPSQPLIEDDPDGTEEFSALQKLRYCEHNKGDKSA